MGEEQPQISTYSPRGATIYTTYAERKVKAYPVFETEIQSLSLFNSSALVGFSSASALFALAAGIWTNAAFAENLSPAAVIATKIVSPALCVAAGVAACFGGWATWKRHSAWQQIKMESHSELRPGARI